MVDWTKTEFDETYSFRVERYLGGHPPDRPEVRINYHEYSMRPILVKRWRNLVRVLTPAITASDFVLIVGAGFGWGVRAIRDRVGCAAIGTDTSSYIQGAKDGDNSAEIGAAISAVGLDPATGRGLEILNAVWTPGNRAKEIVLNEDMATRGSRNRIADALGGAPTWILTEDLVTDADSDGHIRTLAGRLDQSAARKVWIYKPSPARSAQDLANLTGHRVITTGDFQIVTP